MLSDAGFDLVCNETGRKPTPEEHAALVENAFGVIAGTERYDDKLLQRAKALRVIVRFGVGLDNFDMEAIRRRGIRVGVIANYNAVAEYALTLMLALLKNLPRYDGEVRRGLWPRFPMGELTGKTVGIVGFGRIGRRLAELLRGFGVTLLVYDPFVSPETAASLGGEAVTLDVLLERSDVVSLHLPATAETFHLIGRETIGKMKEGALLVNTARGSLVDEEALCAALRENRLGGAALDVFETEPAGKEHPLCALPNVVLSPHAAASTVETNRNGSLTCARSILQVWQGGDPVYPVI